MGDFTDFDNALSLFFSEFGFEATLIKNIDSSYNTATGLNDPTHTETAVEAILMDLTLQSNGMSVKFGTLVQAGDKELYVRPVEKTNPEESALTITPMKDKVRVNGVEYNIITLKEVNTTATEPLMYDLYIRR